MLQLLFDEVTLQVDDNRQRNNLSGVDAIQQTVLDDVFEQLRLIRQFAMEFQMVVHLAELVVATRDSLIDLEVGLCGYRLPFEVVIVPRGFLPELVSPLHHSSDELRVVPAFDAVLILLRVLLQHLERQRRDLISEVLFLPVAFRL